jgi:colicin import membrane protein
MADETTSQGPLDRASLFKRSDPTPARGELVWNEEGALATAAAPTLRESAADLDPEPLPHAVTEEVPLEVIDATAGALAAELARRRAAAFERLDIEMRTRRAELVQAIERQRAEAEQRIAEGERLEREAIARRREQTDQIWSDEQPRNLAERLNGALTAELVETRRRYEAAELRLHAEFEGRRNDEAARLESWRRSERERIEAELAAEEQRFSDRLLRQLQEFEVQLGERQREQEERLVQWWDEAEQLARQKVAALLDEMLSKKAVTGT